MNIKEVKTILPTLLRNKVVPFFWGSQGVGKTQTIKQVAKENNLGFVHLHLATQEVGDLVGLLIHADNGEVKHARPQWFPTEGEGIIFLDEVNRAHPDVLQAMFSLITEGTIHTHKLPTGWSIVAAGNYETNQFNTTDTSDAAWRSRFCHIDFLPSKEEFADYAEAIGADSVAEFIRRYPEMLEVVPKERFNFLSITPDRRSWVDMIARLEEESGLDDSRYEIYSGIVGPTAAASFIQDKQKNHKRLSGRAVIEKYETVRKEVLGMCSDKEARFDLLNSAVEEMFLIVEKRNLNSEEMDNFKQFLIDVPLELGLKVVNKLGSSTWKQKNEVRNNPQFVDMFTQLKMNNKEKK